MVRLLVRVVGIGTETADMLVNEVLSRPMRDRRAVAPYAGLTGAPDESGAKRREQGLAKAGNARDGARRPPECVGRMSRNLGSELDYIERVEGAERRLPRFAAQARLYPTGRIAIIPRLIRGRPLEKNPAHCGLTAQPNHRFPTDAGTGGSCTGTMRSAADVDGMGSH